MRARAPTRRRPPSSSTTTRKTATAYGAPLELFEGTGHWLMEEAGHEDVGALAQAWMRGQLHAH